MSWGIQFRSYPSWRCRAVIPGVKPFGITGEETGTRVLSHSPPSKRQQCFEPDDTTATLNPMRASIWSRTMTQQQRIGRQKTYRSLYQWLSKGVCLIRRGKNLQENFQSRRQPKLQKQTLFLQTSWGSVIQNRINSFLESKPRSLQPVPL